MIQLFKSKVKETVDPKEYQVRMDVKRRAEINSEARKMASKLVSETKVVSIGNAIKMIDTVLDKVSAYENVKITAITELYLALESGDTKNLIKFLKAKEPLAKVKKSSKSKTWKL